MKEGIMSPYISIARPDHWFKNGFMLIGMAIAIFLEPSMIHSLASPVILWAILSVCLVASSNYVINEILDRATDALHPVKKFRAIPSGRVRIPLAYLEWLILAIVGLGIAYFINRMFFISVLMLWIMGLLYNVPPIRTKDWPYVDVLTESINNPIRLFMGWTVLIPDKIPPISIVVSYWMAGAFFMGVKRFGEYRRIADGNVAAAYRKSFSHYNETRLLLSIFSYAMLCCLFFGIFIVRYHLELMFSIPFFVGFFVYYLSMAFWNDSPVQAPERLYKNRVLMLYLILCFSLFVLLLYLKVPILYKIFRVIPYNIEPLWKF